MARKGEGERQIDSTIRPPEERVEFKDKNIDVAVPESEEGREIPKQREGRPDSEKLGEVYKKIDKITSKETALVRPSILPEHKALVEEKVKELKKMMRWKGPAILRGNPTAAAYDSHVTNYSTQTVIIELPSGERIFAVYNYPTSWVHRSISDRLNKFVAGAKMHKVRSGKWKDRFESRTQLPTIENDDPNVVLMPFVPNINLRDLFSRRDQIKDFGECAFAREYAPEDLLQVLEKAAAKLRGVHNKGIGWGETILDNMIIDDKEDVHICDPESKFNDDVSLAEQYARDLLAFIVSAAGAMYKHSVDYAVVVERVMSAYGETSPEVLKHLSAVARKKPGLLQRIFFGGIKPYLGVENIQEYRAIKQAVVEYLEKPEKIK